MKTLIADADPGSLELLARVLSDWDYEVVAVRTGPEALEHLQAPEPPVLAVLAVQLPGAGGIEVCSQLRAAPKKVACYVILRAEAGQPFDVEAAMDEGADDYLSVPLSEPEIRVRLRAALRIIELQQALRAQATRDELTGCWNRTSVLQILDRELTRSLRERTAVALLLADIDHFQQVNAGSSLLGDTVLQQTAARMAALLRAFDALGRYGPDKFLIVLPGCEPANIGAVAERMRRCIAASPIVSLVGSAPITISVGAAATERGQKIDPAALLELVRGGTGTGERKGPQPG